MSTLAEKEKLERGGSRGRAQLTVFHLIGKLEEHVFEIIEAIGRRFPVPVGSDGRHCCGSCVSGVVELKLWRYGVGSGRCMFGQRASIFFCSRYANAAKST